MNIDSIGTFTREWMPAGGGTKSVQPSPTAADFAEMIRKLAGPKMLWEEQMPEQVQENAAFDDTDARGVLASGTRKC